MTRIGLLSDTHYYLDPTIQEHFKNCDEIWHGGDFGNIDIAVELKKFNARATFRGVYGNIDGNDVRSIFPEQNIFMCEEVKVMMRHIGGYPPKYNPETK